MLASAMGDDDYPDPPAHTSLTLNALVPWTSA